MGAGAHDIRVTLPDGRVLAALDVGAEGGIPVLYCHGFPGSRREALAVAPAARAAGVRLLAVDRPGFGASSEAPERCIDDWPRDVEHVLDHLGVARVSVLGLSGGAPYAIAMAALRPARVSRVVLVGAFGPLDGATPLPGLVRLAVSTAASCPRIAALVWRPLVALCRWHPLGVFRLLAATLDVSDRRVLARHDVQAVVEGSLREALRQGHRGSLTDLALLGSRWEGLAARVRAPTLLWHGEADRVVPAAASDRLATRIPGARVHQVPGLGHFALPITRQEAILASLSALA